MPRRLCAAALLLAAGAVSYGQNPVTDRMAPGPGCTPGVNYETEGYQIGTATVHDPFDFLYWIRGKVSSTQTQITALIDGKPFTYNLAIGQALALIEQQRFLPDNATGFRATVEFAAAINCHQNPNTLDLSYQIYSTVPPKILSGTPESQAMARTSPQDAAGLTQGGSPVHFTPSGGFNNSEKLYGGGRLAITKPSFPLFRTFVAEGRGSSTMREMTLALEGSADRLGRLAHMDWRLNYYDSYLPAGADQVHRAQLSGQFAGASQPFWNGNVTWRFGGEIEGGNQGSSFAPKELAANTVAGAGFGALKVYTGLASRLPRNVFSVTYGLELGSLAKQLQVDWRKHIVDVVEEFWVPLRDHYPLEVETRFTVGVLQVPGTAPAAERFFAGNDPAYFLPGDSWQIRSNPYIRAIPANHLFFTGQGAGAGNFQNVNVTVAAPLKAWPLIPSTVGQEALPLLDGQITSATSLLQNHYALADAGFQPALDALAPLQTVLTTLKAAVASARTNNPEIAAPVFTACNNSVLLAAFDVKQALQKMSEAKRSDTLYGLAIAPLTDVPAMTKACVDGFGAGMSAADAAPIRDAAAAAGKLRDTIQAANDGVQAAAKARATNDTKFVRRTIHTLVSDMNIISVGPVGVFDIARLGPTMPGVKGVRYGPGGGLRLSVASVVNFTVGYAWNVGRQAGESRGAVFFQIGMRDLFH